MIPVDQLVMRDPEKGIFGDCVRAAIASLLGVRAEIVPHFLQEAFEAGDSDLMLDRVNDWLRSRGVRHIGLDSDGAIDELIPIWVDSGVNMLWPFEVQSGMDVVDVRAKYGHDLVIMGGIDKRALAVGGDTTQSGKGGPRKNALASFGSSSPLAPPTIHWAAPCLARLNETS